MWILLLNDMRTAHSETVQPVAWGETREELEELVRRERVELYKEETGLPETSLETEPSSWSFRYNAQTWCKGFRKGGPLEWCNPPFIPEDHYIDAGDKLRIIGGRIFKDVGDAPPRATAL